MTADDELVKGFAMALGIAPSKVIDSLAYQSIPEWDSVGHMSLIAELESRFKVMLDTDEILDLSSVATAKQILGRHGVDFLVVGE
ncbi:MAG: acyl carrier protein [Pirellulaceae bacterium]|nr:acyl carrier protein [Pirellulaceae bacterium]